MTIYTIPATPQIAVTTYNPRYFPFDRS